jgi:FKBP12-rapamycin complex-associated protein
MVGYILGLGDRHPSNLMVDRVSGRVVHIDFGDCFEVTAKRTICPEIVPFRLTRMITNAMETSGIEGTYRVNCERTIRVLRENRDSVMAMLEAFVYDPLISWRLLKSTKNDMINSWDAAATGAEDQSAVDRIREQIPTGSALGLSIDDSDEQSWKVYVFMVVIVVGIVTCDRLVHPENIAVPGDVKIIIK